jgi:hypothetical protein
MTNTSFERHRAQLYCENLAGCKDIEKWGSYRAIFEKLSLTPAQATALKTELQNDAGDLYYKGLLSLSEGVNSVSRHLYSWALIKFYYSLYYFLRCSLACHGYCVVRNGRLYTLKCVAGESPVNIRDGKF